MRLFQECHQRPGAVLDAQWETKSTRTAPSFKSRSEENSASEKGQR